MAVVDARTQKFLTGKLHRGTQVIFGERKHLMEVLASVKLAKLPLARKRQEIGQLKKLISARTAELEQITPRWDKKFKTVQNPKASARELARIAAKLSPEDYLTARALTEHPEAPPEMLARMAGHAYSAVRENVARHPHTPADVLRKFADDSGEPLWFLVACNPSTPPDLKNKLRARMRESAKAIS